MKATLAKDLVIGKWISVNERLPTEEDGDENGKVLIYRKTNDAQRRMSKTIYDVFMVKYCDQNTFWTKLSSNPSPSEIEQYLPKEKL